MFCSWRLRTVAVVLAAAAAGAGCLSRPAPPTQNQPAGSSPGVSSAATSFSHAVPAAQPGRPAQASTSGPAGGLALLSEPQAGYGFAVDAIDQAKTRVDLAMYELADQAVEQALIDAAARHVAVTVLLDSRYERTANQLAAAALSGAGVTVRWASPAAIFHEKALCVDDMVCYVMTGNLTARYYRDTRDFVVVDRRPADVADIVATFAGDLAGGPPTSGGRHGDLVWSPGATPTLVSLIASATKTLLVENEEMNDPQITAALVGAARRGVAVEVVMTRSNRFAAAFDTLSGAGVVVRTYRADAPLYIHAKAVVADDVTVFVGSENFSVASLHYNRELGVISRDPTLVRGVAAQIEADAAQATPWQP